MSLFFDEIHNLCCTPSKFKISHKFRFPHTSSQPSIKAQLNYYWATKLLKSRMTCEEKVSEQDDENDSDNENDNDKSNDSAEKRTITSIEDISRMKITHKIFTINVQKLLNLFSTFAMTIDSNNRTNEISKIKCKLQANKQFNVKYKKKMKLTKLRAESASETREENKDKDDKAPPISIQYKPNKSINFVVSAEPHPIQIRSAKCILKKSLDLGQYNILKFRLQAASLCEYQFKVDRKKKNSKSFLLKSAIALSSYISGPDEYTQTIGLDLKDKSISNIYLMSMIKREISHSTDMQSKLLILTEVTGKSWSNSTKILGELTLNKQTKVSCSFSNKYAISLIANYKFFDNLGFENSLMAVITGSKNGIKHLTVELESSYI